MRLPRRRAEPDLALRARLLRYQRVADELRGKIRVQHQAGVIDLDAMHLYLDVLCAAAVECGDLPPSPEHQVTDADIQELLSP